MGSEVYKSTESLFLLDYIYTEGEDITFMIYIKSLRYSGEHRFCLRYKKLTEIIFTLELMKRKQQGDVTIADQRSDSYVKIKYINSELYISGQIGGSNEDHFMVFKFKAESSIISAIIANLDGALEKPQAVYYI